MAQNASQPFPTMDALHRRLTAKAADLDGNPYVFDAMMAVPLDVLYGKPGFGMAPPAMEAGRPWPPPTSTSEEGALPVSFGPRVEVNGYMQQAARGAAICSGYLPYDDGTNEAIYRAMHAAAPVVFGEPTYDGGPSHLAALARERDQANERCTRQASVLGDTANEIALLRLALAAKDTRIAELKSILACTPVAFEDPDAKPAPVPGFLRAIRRGNKATVGLVTGRGDMPTPIDD